MQGPGTRIVVTAWPYGGFDSSNGHYGVFLGAWQSGALVLTGIADSAITGDELASGGAVDQKAMFRISIDAFAGDRNQMWAVAADNTTTNAGAGDGQLYAVLRSHDGGATWQAVHAQLVIPDNPSATLRGSAGGWAGNGRNSAVAVGLAPETVAIGWVYGPFISIDDGYTFAYHNDPDAGHSDYAMLRWSRAGRLYACTDGGIAYTDNQGATWETGLNRRLATMNFYSPTGGREFYGLLASSKPASVGGQVVSAVAGGVQDNGDIWTRVVEGRDPEPWHHLRGGDGGPSVFVDDTLVEAAVGEGGDVFKSDRWDGTTLMGQDVIPIAGGTDGLGNSCIAAVNAPTHAPDGSMVVAVAGYSKTDGTNNIHTVYGLIKAADGTLSWSALAQVQLAQSQIMASIASWSGSKIYFGLRGTASVYSLTVGSMAPPVMEPGFPNNGGWPTAVARIVLGGEDDAYALLVDWQNNVYKIFHHDPGAASWSEVGATGLPCLPGVLCPSGPISGSWPTNLLWSFEVDFQASPRLLFVATDDQVLALAEGSSAWIDVSHGLPRRAHVADLRIVRDPDGTRHMLASTYGRSVWRATF